MKKEYINHADSKIFSISLANGPYYTVYTSNLYVR